MKLAKAKGSADVTVNIYIVDTSGSALTGLVYNSSGLTCYYAREAGASTQISLATQTTTGTHSDGGFVEIDATNMPGWYRLDLPDACCASGADHVGVHLQGATSMQPLPLEIQLDLMEQVETEIYEAAITSHDTAGTFGELLNDASESIATNGVALSTTMLQSIADTLLERDIDNVEDSAGKDTLAGYLLSKLYFTISGTTLTILKTDGATLFATKTLTTGTSDPVTGIS